MLKFFWLIAETVNVDIKKMNLECGNTRGSYPFLKQQKGAVRPEPYIYNLLSVYSLASNNYCTGSKGVTND